MTNIGPEPSSKKSYEYPSSAFVCKCPVNAPNAMTAPRMRNHILLPCLVCGHQIENSVCSCCPSLIGFSSQMCLVPDSETLIDREFHFGTVFVHDDPQWSRVADIRLPFKHPPSSSSNEMLGDIFGSKFVYPDMEPLNKGATRVSDSWYHIPADDRRPEMMNHGSTQEEARWIR